VDVNGLDVLDDTGTHTHCPDVSLLISKPLAQFKPHNGPYIDTGTHTHCPDGSLLVSKPLAQFKPHNGPSLDINGLDVEDPPGCKVVDVVG